jgi:hypothetical protein
MGIAKGRIRLTRLFASLSIEKLGFLQHVIILGLHTRGHIVLASIHMLQIILHKIFLVPKTACYGFLDFLSLDRRPAITSMAAS